MLGNKILAGHDISDGGLVTCILEMAFGGISGVNIDLEEKCLGQTNPLDVLFAEELGWVLEVEHNCCNEIQDLFAANDVPILYIGESQGYGMNSKVRIIC